MRRFAKQSKGGTRSDTSILIMKIGSKIVVDGCHNYRTHIFNIDDPVAPKLFRREYDCDADVMDLAPWSKAHNSIPAWSQWVRESINSKTPMSTKKPWRRSPARDDDLDRQPTPTPQRATGYTDDVQGDPAPEPEAETTGPIILEVKENLEQVQWRVKIEPRKALIPVTLPENVRTPLKSHQVESFKWQVEAWKSGLPGILNADEQGLGKTLQTISFIAWLKAQMAQQGAKPNGPILIVAPTSLLENWEQEVERHLTPGGLGHLIRLYGSGISTRRRHGAQGKDTLDGEEHLDLSFLHEAMATGSGHQYWLLTTYTTLTNYQHSLGAIPFSALVFDEIQALREPWLSACHRGHGDECRLPYRSDGHAHREFDNRPLGHHGTAGAWSSGAVDGIQEALQHPRRRPPESALRIRLRGEPGSAADGAAPSQGGRGKGVALEDTDPASPCHPGRAGRSL